MPELPDVEGFRRTFQRRAAGKQVRGASCDAEILRNSSPQALGRAMRNSTFEAPERWGKWLICPAGANTMLMHFGMTGELIWLGDETERHPDDRMVLHFSDGDLRYRNMRKLGGVWLARTDAIEEVLGPLGPDALELRENAFIGRLKDRKGSIKSALMDQKVLAGLGNLTVDESLWHARVSPRASIKSLARTDISRLYRKMNKVLRDSAKEGLVPAKRTWLTGARSQRDPRCPRCRAKLNRGTIAGRTTYWCPSCQ
jgi:formamidopyrimidine-DNA glycosylase